MDVESASCSDDGVVVVLSQRSKGQRPAMATNSITASQSHGNGGASANNASPVLPPSGTTATKFDKTPTETATRKSPPSVPCNSSNGISTNIKQVLNLHFPRCSCCNTGWYDAIEDEDHNLLGDNKPSANDNDASANRKQYQSKNRGRPSHYALLPMPKCGCTTRLALPPLPSAITSSNTHDCGLNKNVESLIDNGSGSNDPSNLLSKIQTHSFPNLAMCRPCLRKRIAASEEVTEHDYRMEHIPNGQRNVRFTVEPNCVVCHRKFMVRVLQRLLESNDDRNDDQRSSLGSRQGYDPNKSYGKKDNGKGGADWYDAVDATIQLVGWAKREYRKEKRNLRNQRSAKRARSGASDIDKRKKGWWETHYKSIRTSDDDYSSDECYSLPSDSDDESCKSKMRHRVQELEEGELLSDLLKKDPKFRQQHEDEQFLKQLIVEEEKKAAEQALRDQELAKKIQEELNKEDKMRDNKTPAKRPHSKGPTILEALNKQPTSSASSATKLAGKKRDLPSKGTAEVQSKKPRANGKGDTQHFNANQQHATNLSATATSTSSIEKDIGLIVSMGFSEDSALRCLNDAGSVELAVSMLLSETADRQKAENH